MDNVGLTDAEKKQFEESIYKHIRVEQLMKNDRICVLVRLIVNLWDEFNDWDNYYDKEKVVKHLHMYKNLLTTNLGLESELAREVSEYIKEVESGEYSIENNNIYDKILVIRDLYLPKE